MLGVSPASDTNTRGLGEAKLSTVLVTLLAPGIMCLRFVLERTAYENWYKYHG